MRSPNSFDWVKRGRIESYHCSIRGEAMKRVTPEPSYSAKVDNLDKFTLFEIVILPSLVALISIIWYPLKVDAGALAEKGIGPFDIDAGVSDILLVLLPVLTAILIITSIVFRKKLLLDAIQSATFVFMSVSLALAFSVLGMLLLSVVQNINYSDTINEVRTEILEDNGYDNIKQSSSEDYDYEVTRDGEPRSIDFFYEDGELKLDEVTHNSIPIKK